MADAGGRDEDGERGHEDSTQDVSRKRPLSDPAEMPTVPAAKARAAYMVHAASLAYAVDHDGDVALDTDGEAELDVDGCDGSAVNSWYAARRQSKRQRRTGRIGEDADILTSA